MTIKKILTTLFIFCCLQSAFSQTELSSHYLDLKKSRDHHETLAAPEAGNHGLVVFATDKTTVTALQYTRVLYYKDSLATQRPDINEYDFMAGYSYNNSGQPSVYWASDDLKKIQELHYNFETRTITDYSFEMPFTNESVISTFSENNSFYILTMPKLGAKLKLYVFNEGRYLQRFLDFSDFNFKNEDNKPAALTALLEAYPIQKIESVAFNALPTTAAKIKLYVSENEMQLTFDQNPAYTQLFIINTTNYSVAEKIIPQQLLEDGTANSFLYNKKLYQVSLNEEEMSISATNVQTGELIKAYEAGKDDTITFKNSPLLEQMGNRPSNEFKNTKRFLRKAASGGAAISVYQTPNDIMVSAGAIRSVTPAGDLILGAALSGTMIAAGADPGNMASMFPGSTQSIYFESLFDDNFNHKPLPQQRLAADYIGRYIGENEKNVSLETVFPYNYYYVLGYYNAKAKKYVLVKFHDDFVE